MNHTPGPWELWTGCSWRRFGSKSTGQPVCEPTNSPTDGHPDLIFHNGGQDGPDARLIAAAPDLLEAAVLVHDWLHSFRCPKTATEQEKNVAIERLGKAIVRATEQ